MPHPLDNAARDDDDDAVAKDSIESIEASRRILVRSIKDPIHDYSASVSVPLNLRLMILVLQSLSTLSFRSSSTRMSLQLPITLF